MVNCNEDCTFQDGGQCWFACHDKLYQMGKTDGIKDFAEWLTKHFDLRFSSNPEVWVDEYFNHTREKVLEQLKEQTE